MNAPPLMSPDAAGPPRVKDMPATRDASLIYGRGEMAELIRRHDWATTPLGPIDEWPEALITIVNTLLDSRHPMLLMWGPHLVQFYNDAFRPSIREDKHPSALGKKASECWAEIWHIIGPQLHSVFWHGESVWNEDTLVPINRNGKLEDVYWTYGYSPVRASSGAICGVLVVCTETTGNVNARRQLQRERERLADLFQQAPAFFCVLDGPEFVFEMLNPRYQELIGNREVLGKPVREAVPEAEEQGFLPLLERVYTTGEPFVGHNIPVRLARRGSDALELRYLNFVYQPRRDTDGRISGIIVLGVDVTEGRRAEQALIQSEKLTALGRLASSIAHEINNPLEAVTNLLFLAQATAINPETKEYLEAAEQELRRVSAITSHTLRFHRQSTHPREVTAAELVDATVALFQGKLGSSRITVERRDRARRCVTCFDGEIRQVLNNLIGNAVDALGPNGRLVLRSRDAVDGKTGRNGVLFTVADNGSGMAPYTKERIFEPFFTTKGASGTGLGLWISREIVERHQGRLKVRSSQTGGRAGTVFELFLPVQAA